MGLFCVPIRPMFAPMSAGASHVWIAVKQAGDAAIWCIKYAAANGKCPGAP